MIGIIVVLILGIIAMAIALIIVTNNKKDCVEAGNAIGCITTPSPTPIACDATTQQFNEESTNLYTLLRLQQGPVTKIKDSGEIVVGGGVKMVDPLNMKPVIYQYTAAYAVDTTWTVADLLNPPSGSYPTSGERKGQICALTVMPDNSIIALMVDNPLGVGTPYYCATCYLNPDGSLDTTKGAGNGMAPWVEFDNVSERSPDMIVSGGYSYVSSTRINGPDTLVFLLRFDNATGTYDSAWAFKDLLESETPAISYAPVIIPIPTQPAFAYILSSYKNATYTGIKIRKVELDTVSYPNDFNYGSGPIFLIGNIENSLVTGTSDEAADIYGVFPYQISIGNFGTIIFKITASGDFATDFSLGGYIMVPGAPVIIQYGRPVVAANNNLILCYNIVVPGFNLAGYAILDPVGRFVLNVQPDLFPPFDKLTDTIPAVIAIPGSTTKMLLPFARTLGIDSDAINDGYPIFKETCVF